MFILRVCTYESYVLCVKSCAPFVTGFEKTRLPHTQYQTYDFTRNELLAQYTIVFHCWPCSKATGLVSVAAFLRPCVRPKWHYGAIGWSWLFYWCLEGWTSHEGLANVCYLQFGVL